MLGLVLVGVSRRDVFLRAFQRLFHDPSESLQRSVIEEKPGSQDVFVLLSTGESKQQSSNQWMI